jgi:hypothetical protein
MKIMRQIFIIISAFYTCLLSAQNLTEDLNTYLDQNNKQITAEEFVRIMDSQDVLVVDNDSLKTYKIVTERIVKGKIGNFELIAEKLQSRTNIVIDRTKPIVVIYHPGKDRYNSSGSSSNSERRTWFNTLTRKVKRIAKVEPIYVYKTKEGTERYEGILTWHKDPEGIIERTFFDYHYPSSSYVLLSPNGNYIAAYGECPKELLWKHLEELVNQN